MSGRRPIVVDDPEAVAERVRAAIAEHEAGIERAREEIAVREAAIAALRRVLPRLRRPEVAP